MAGFDGGRALYDFVANEITEQLVHMTLLSILKTFI